MAAIGPTPKPSRGIATPSPRPANRSAPTAGSVKTTCSAGSARASRPERDQQCRHARRADQAPGAGAHPNGIGTAAAGRRGGWSSRVSRAYSPSQISTRRFRVAAFRSSSQATGATGPKPLAWATRTPRWRSCAATSFAR